MSEYPIACICGSTRFKDEIAEANRLLTLEGCIVLAPGVFGHSGDLLTDVEKAALDAMHLKKIEMSNLVYVVNPAGYIGASTWNEICHAKMLGKKILFLAEIPDDVGDSACRRRLAYAERLAWESLDEMRHRGALPPDEATNPWIRMNGFRFSTPG